MTFVEENNASLSIEASQTCVRIQKSKYIYICIYNVQTIHLIHSFLSLWRLSLRHISFYFTNLVEIKMASVRRRRLSARQIRVIRVTQNLPISDDSEEEKTA